MSQDQFLEVIDRDEAERRFRGAIRCRPLGPEEVALDDALSRVLAEDVVAEVDVPSFDRSNYDGYAVRAADTYGAQEENPRRLGLLEEVLATGVVPRLEVTPGVATEIATGGMLPRGADAVVMVEHTETEGGRLIVARAVTPGFGVAFAGTDISSGETVLRRGQVLTSRETGVLAALGNDRVQVFRRPNVAILCTGDEIIPPGEPMRPGLVYDSNARILADAVRELRANPIPLGIVHDDLEQLRRRLHEALERADVVLLSGGTSKGAGDLSYRVVSELAEPGIVAHGVALKPGKPICLAGHRGKPVVILPGFPTSAIFTFHEFVAPVIRVLGGRPAMERSSVEARLAVKVNSEIGRTEYLLVGLVGGEDQLAAYPMGKGSGSVTSFSQADGFVTIGRHEEIVQSGSTVTVQLLGGDLQVADLVVIGSHCVGLDFLLGQLEDRGFRTKFMAVGSAGGLEAAKRGECDLAGMHLLDPDTGRYNEPYLTADLQLVRGYGRLQGVVFRPEDARFEGRGAREAIAAVKGDPRSVMVNRNRGSGTRILIDRLLGGTQPPGYAVQAKSHNAVAAAVLQGRADWGVAIEWVAKRTGLGFLPLEQEQYDFVVPAARLDRPAVVAFRRLVSEPEIRGRLGEMGFGLNDE
ncbi:MAG TPA: molybdopterin biosynthesis protein [Thermoguttaceae bacterium]|nr:molybdopterin biosynthesis protein [Thermoguttaceae bacterium]